MKRRISFVLIAILSLCAMGEVAAKSYASSVRALEFEVGAAMVSPAQRLDFDRNKVGFNIHGEVRYNFKYHPFDVGLRVDGDKFNAFDTGGHHAVHSVSAATADTDNLYLSNVFKIICNFKVHFFFLLILCNTYLHTYNYYTSFKY